MLQLDLQSRQPIYEQLIEKLSEMISAGALKSEEKLPSVRNLARELGVNPNTVQKSYQELERNGIIYSVAGKGSFIAPGNRANETVCRQRLVRIKEVVMEGKRAGVSYQQVDKTVRSVYEEVMKHD